MFDYSQKHFFHVSVYLFLKCHSENKPSALGRHMRTYNWFIQSLTILQLWRALFASFEPKVGTLEAQLAGAPR